MTTLSTSEITTIIANSLAAIAALLGIGGIWQWRKQLKFGDQYKTAHRVIGLCLRFKREFNLVRHPTAASAIIQASAAGIDLIAHSENLQQDFNERQSHLVELFGVVEKLYDESLEVEGYLGVKEAGLIVPLKNSYTILNDAFTDYQQLIYALQIDTDIQDAFENLQKNHDILFGNADDAFMNRIDDEIENIRKRLRKYVR